MTYCLLSLVTIPEADCEECVQEDWRNFMPNLLHIFFIKWDVFHVVL
jgi:hypothetical protein